MSCDLPTEILVAAEIRDSEVIVVTCYEGAFRVMIVHTLVQRGVAWRGWACITWRSSSTRARGDSGIIKPENSYTRYTLLLAR